MLCIKYTCILVSEKAVLTFFQWKMRQAHIKQLKDMVVANTITTHLEQMFYELKEDGQIWQDWDAYFNSYLKVDGFKNNWRQNQSTYSHSFRTYVNSKLV